MEEDQLILYTHQSTPAETTIVSDFLSRHSIPFKVVDVTSDNDLQNEIKKRKNGRETYPQVFLNLESLGGLEDLKQLETEGALTGIKKRLILRSPQKPTHTGRVLLTPPQSPNAKIMIMEEENKVEKLIRKMRDGKVGLKISNRNFHTKNYKRVFSGSEFVDWILKNRLDINSEIPSDFLQDLPDSTPTPTTPNTTPTKQPPRPKTTGLIQTKAEAIKLGQKLLNEKLIKSIQNSRTFSPDSTQFYRFQLDEVQYLLNMDKIWASKIKSESQLITDLQNQITNLYEHFSSTSTTSSSIPLINYSLLAKSEDFSFFKLSVAKLQKFNLNYFRENPSTSKNLEELAFFTNLYNILVIHGIIAIGAPHTAVQRAKFFSNVAYNIGGLIFSLNDIEHGILRGNLYCRPGKEAWSKQFGVNDERLLHVIPEAHIDPRVLLCLNRGSKGSVVLRVYEAEKMEQELKESVDKYLRTTAGVDEEAKEVRIGKLMDWYSADFGGVDRVVEFVGKNGGFGQKDVKEFRVRFECFDWSSNAV